MLSCSVVPNSLRPPGPQPTRLLCTWDSPGRNPGVGCHALLQGIFPTQELKPHLLKWQAGYFFFFPHLATCEEALTRCRIIHKFLLASKGGCFWPYSEVHHGPSDCHCKNKLDFAVGMWHPSEGISQAADERLLFM